MKILRMLGKFRLRTPVPKEQVLGFFECPATGAAHRMSIQDYRAEVINEVCPDCQEMVGPAWIYENAEAGKYERVEE